MAEMGKLTPSTTLTSMPLTSMNIAHSSWQYNHQNGEESRDFLTNYNN